ncbi:DUF1330 domain-containing protein [Aquimarina algiphila]|uniref:DUF1330 domain-containing protein n=1 Tax=Aquimarina algiphila TaxID=2047982 RepID=A0A554VD17_9FLAO|nr:DUF1330 domain-containing protein [Aquimarina algiphila]TSE04683.1 DUF1330 domain-containing protein [Aquimarina algiphila]
MIYLTMMIFVKDGKEEVFHQFEELAIPLLKDYKGKLVYRLRPTKESFISHEDELPYEIHFLSFESESDFVNFAKDERRKDFLHLKEESIRSSFLIKGMKV